MKDMATDQPLLKLLWRITPDVKFKREYLGPETNFDGECFDGFYSISVLEHVPLEAFEGLSQGIRKASRSNAIVLHAVDHVLRGAGAEYHVQILAKAANECGVPLSDLWEVLGSAEEDVETYFLSAEAHNRYPWRDALRFVSDAEMRFGAL